MGDMNDKVPALPINISSRRMSKSGAGGLPSPPASMPAHKYMNMEGQENQNSAIDDQENVSPEEGDSFQKARGRRASDGQSHAKEGRRFNRPELRCEHCGKGYKHSSCLTKHLWEHTPEWSYTSKLLISKHQQVQLLEAASVLVAMNNQPTSPPDSARESSPSVFGGSSEQMDGRSSANTTPPPHLETMHSGESERYHFSPTSPFNGDIIRSGLARSLHPAPSESSYATSVPYGSGFGYHRQYLEPSPPPAGSSISGEADHLVKGVAMLSCSYTSNSGSQAGQLPQDIPDIPPIPAHFLSQASLGQSPFLSSFPTQAPESFTRGDRRRGSEDVRMELCDDDDMRSRARSDEYDVNDGFFGGMEE
ncbi:hypothetical protein VMCG_07119 [Cytospora schulzeri]|uniref:C2H2-type domain-containing protein n=1 Tax=Cytospora schulzeri TaxID=448051 RepID=A0A423W4V3_9PEZI|nr:hypothetical protein VMCG_07119 [Valsa malicola]